MKNRLGGEGRIGKDPDIQRTYLNDIGKHALLTAGDEVRLGADIMTAQELSDPSEKFKAKLAINGLFVLTGQEPPIKLDLHESQITDAFAFAAAQKGLQQAIEQPESWQRRISRKAAKASETMINSNLRLVVSIAKKFQASELPLMDLIQEGNLGVMHAVEKFDYRQGNKFSTYATWWIKQAIQRGIANTGKTIRVPIHRNDKISKYRRAKSDLEQELGRDASDEEVAYRLGFSVDDIKAIAKDSIITNTMSLNIAMGEDGDTEFSDILESRESTDAFERVEIDTNFQKVKQALARLPERQRRVFELRFGLVDGETRTLEEVGKHFQITRERVRQIERDALLALSNDEDIRGIAQIEGLIAEPRTFYVRVRKPQSRKTA